MIDGADRDLFERSLAHAVESAAGSEAGGGTGPGSGEGAGGHDPAALDAALAELGWAEALTVDPRTAVSLLFELQGAGLAASTALDRVLTAGFSGPSPEAAEAPSGARVLLPRLGRVDAPGTADDDGRLTVHGLLTNWTGDGADTVLVVTALDGAHVAGEIPMASLTCRAVEGVDPALNLAEVSGTVDLPSDLRSGPVDWEAAVAVAQRAVGHELVGVARRMLALAREHALDRVQFGRPIAGFQAVRHRLAEAFVAVEAADAALADAWLDGTPVATAMAKASAGRGVQAAGRHCQQVLAGIGYTTEHPFHRYQRRALVLDQLLGSTRRLTRDLGSHLLATRQIPTPLPL